LLEASATENPDLFWAIRGGGGNFGIATSFEYRLHPFDGRAVGGHLVFPFAQARPALRSFGELYDRAPDTLWVEPILTTMPGGARALVLDVCLTDGLESADAVLAPYRQLGKPINDSVGTTQYVRLQTQDDERARIGGRYYTKSGFLNEIGDDLVDTMLEIIASAPVPRARIAVPPKGAAVNRVAPDATAFWHRGALYSLLMQASGDEAAEDAANVGWGRSQWPALEKFTTGFYANMDLTEVPQARVREAYGGNYERLVTLKRKYDPTNLFRLNANIDPKEA
jgi:FAD/FMN-containing dehydrogenase